MLFITFHGGKPPKLNAQSKGGNDPEASSTPVNNIYAYSDKGGPPIETKVLHGADEYLKHGELRDIAFHEKHLYVLNGRKDANLLLRFKGSGTKYKFQNVVASREGKKGVSSILHPFALTFQGKKFCYISNQDTNVVTRLRMDGRKCKTGEAAIVPPSLSKGGIYSDGTFVASSAGQLPGLPRTTPEPLPQGLGVFIDPVVGKVHFSVRDILAVGKLLYVCDEPAGMVKVYDSHGRLRHFSNPVPRPAHLLLHNDNLYVSGGDQVMTAHIKKHPLYFAPVDGVDGQDASGMAFNRKGDRFFVANRKANNVYCYNVHVDGSFGNKREIIQETPDHPEFLLYVKE